MRDYQAIDAAESERSPQAKMTPKRVAASAADPRYATGSPQVLARIPSLATADPVLQAETDSDSDGRLLSAWISKKVLAGAIVVLVVVAVVSSQFFGGKDSGKDKDKSGSVAQGTPDVQMGNRNTEAPTWPGARTESNTWQAGTPVAPMSQDPNAPDSAYSPSRIEDWRHPTESIASRQPYSATGQPGAGPAYEPTAPNSPNAPSQWNGAPYADNLGNSTGAPAWNERGQDFSRASAGLNRSMSIEERTPIAAPESRGARPYDREIPFGGYRSPERNEAALDARTADAIPDWRNPPRDNARSGAYPPARSSMNSRPTGSYDGAAMPTNYQDQPSANRYQKASPARYDASNAYWTTPTEDYPSTAGRTSYAGADPVPNYQAGYPSTTYPSTSYPTASYPTTSYPATDYGPAAGSGVAQFEGSIQKPNVRISNERTRPSVY